MSENQPVVVSSKQIKVNFNIGGSITSCKVPVEVLQKYNELSDRMSRQSDIVTFPLDNGHFMTVRMAEVDSMWTEECQ